MGTTSVASASGGTQPTDTGGAGAQDGGAEQGYTICIKVDAQNKISVGVTPASADDNDADDDDSSYAPAPNIKDALTTALDIYRNQGQVSDSDSDFNSGYGSKSQGKAAAKSTYSAQNENE